MRKFKKVPSLAFKGINKEEKLQEENYHLRKLLWPITYSFQSSCFASIPTHPCSTTVAIPLLFLPKMLPKVHQIDLKDSLVFFNVYRVMVKLKTANENTSLILVQSFLKQLTVTLQSLQTSRQARADSKSMRPKMISRASWHSVKRFLQSFWLEPSPRDRPSASISEDMSVNDSSKTDPGSLTFFLFSSNLIFRRGFLRLFFVPSECYVWMIWKEVKIVRTILRNR